MFLNDSQLFILLEEAVPYSPEKDEYLTRKQAAKLLGITANTLAIIDHRGQYNLQPNKEEREVRYLKCVIKRVRLERLRVKKRRRRKA